jgi:hypothetical protein
VAYDKELNPNSEEELTSSERLPADSSLVVTEEGNVLNRNSYDNSCVKQELLKTDGDEVKSSATEDVPLEEPRKRQRSASVGTARPHLECHSIPILSPSSSSSFSPKENTISHDDDTSPMQESNDSLTGGVSRDEQTRRRLLTHQFVASQDEIAFMQSQILSQLAPLDLSPMTGCDPLRFRRGDALPVATDEDVDDPVDLRLRSLAFHPPTVFGL